MKIPSKAGTHVCPWWLAYTFDNPLHRQLHPPEKIPGAHIFPGMTVLDIGCGFGHFAIGMASLVSDSGCVIALEVQPQMIAKTMRRAVKKGVAHIVRHRLARNNNLDVKEPLDFALVSRPGVLREQCAVLRKPGDLCLS